MFGILKKKIKTQAIQKIAKKNSPRFLVDDENCKIQIFFEKFFLIVNIYSETEIREVNRENENKRKKPANQ